MKISRKTELLVVLSVALALRLCWVLIVQNELIGDAPWFHSTAKGLLRDGRFHYENTPTAFFPVGYPAFLSVVYSIGGPNPLAAKVANAFLSTFICFLSFLTARQILGTIAARITLYTIALYPSQIFFTSLVTTEVLFTTMLCLCLWLLTTDQGEEGKLFTHFCAGLSLGAACLVRSVPVFMPFVLIVYWLFIKKVSIGSIVMRLAFLLIGTGLILAPWAIRNTRTFHTFVLVSTNGGVNFWLGQVEGRFIEAPDRFTANWLRPSTFPNEEIHAEKLAYREAFDYLKQHPFSPVLHFPRKLLKFYYADIDGLLHNSGLPRIFSVSEVLPVVNRLEIPAPSYIKLFLFVLSQSYYMILLFGFLTGLYLSIRQRADARIYFLLLFIAAWTLFHTVIFFTLGRYRFPIAPFMIIVASYGFTTLYSQRKSKQASMPA